jgi:hypothetical protein
MSLISRIKEKILTAINSIEKQKEKYDGSEVELQRINIVPELAQSGFQACCLA